MSSPGTLRFGQVAATPSAPPVGYDLIYVKTDDVLYIQDSAGVEVALGSASSITQLVGEVTAIGPGVATATVSNSAVIGKVLTGFVPGPNSTVLATDTILQAFEKLQAQVSAGAGSAVTSLTGDVTGTGPGATATTVVSVGGSSAASIHSAELAANAATSSNTASTIVKRDASGNFAANIITASLSGNATTSTTSTNFTGSLSGDVTGTQSATVVASVGGKSAAAVAQSVTDTQAATSSNTASTIVKRDASGNFSASTITANLTGTASQAVNFTGSLSGDVTGGQSTTAIANTVVTGKTLTGFSSAPGTVSAADTILTAIDKLDGNINASVGSAITALTSDVSATGPGSVPATVNSVGGSSAANIHSAELAANAATAVNTPSTIVKRDASGNFSASTITANLTGTATNATTAVNFSGSLSGDVTGTQTTTAISNTTVTGKILTGYVVGPNTPIAATDSILTALEKTQGQINATTGAAITALTGDVVATGPGSVSSTIQPNVVSNSKLAQMPANTLKGNNTAGTANASDLTVAQVTALAAGTPVTQLPDQSNAAGTANTLVRSDHIHNIPSGVPVQIGTTNVQGSAASFSLADHVHSHGNQTVGTLHAAATTTVNGFMSATDKVKLNTFSTVPGTNAQILVSDGTSLNPVSMSGDATITNAGVVSVNSVTGTIPVNRGGTGATTAPAARVNLNIDERSTFSNAAYTVLSTDRYVAQIGTMSATRIVTLPAANSVNPGQQLLIVDESGTVTTTNTLTITAAGADTINGSATKTIRSAFGYINLYSNGTNEWFTGVEAIGRGGTGIATLPADGQLLIGGTATNSYTVANLTAGTGISITNGAGSITIASSGSTATTTKTANYTILTTDSTIFTDSSGGAFTLTLPSPTSMAGKIFRIIDTTGSMATNNVTLARSAAEKIEGLAASKVLQTAWGWFQVTTNGTDWFVG